MRIAFIGDIVGRPARKTIKHHLKKIRSEYEIDFVIANCENASHGFGLTFKNADELLSSGIDYLTGGNHTWDKKDMLGLLLSKPILRPHNYPEGVVGSGVAKLSINGEKFAILNLMGHFSMPMCNNPFICAKEEVKKLKDEGYNSIFIDFHAEATAEKRGLMALLKGEVSAICGTHTHIGTDDLVIDRDTFYVTDIGLTGCRDNVIGMDEAEPIKKMLTGMPARYDIPTRCKTILQMAIVDIEDGKAVDGFKIKAYGDSEPFISQKALIES